MVAIQRRHAALDPAPKEGLQWESPSTSHLDKAVKNKNRTWFRLLILPVGGLLMWSLTMIPSETVSQTTQYLESQLTIVPTPTLDYGLELGYILPLDVLGKLAEVSDSVQFNKVQMESFESLAASLQKGSVKAGVLGHRVRAPQTWTITSEKAGFEIASYLSPPPEEIRRLMEIANNTHFQMDPELSVFHINIDATNRSIEEVRRVYKNFIAVENAMDSVMYPYRSTGTKKLPVVAARKYDSIIERYNRMDDPLELPYPSWDRRTKKAGKVVQKRLTRPKLCLAMNKKTGGPRSFEFRDIESSQDPNLVLAWVEFARKFVAVSYAGKLLAPLERNLDEQWKALFGTLIQDATLEAALRAWRRGTVVMNPNRIAVIKAICPFRGGKICHGARARKKYG